MLNKSLKRSLPKTKIVHGIEIKKIPLGRHLQMLETVEELPDEIVHKLEDLELDGLMDLIISGNITKVINTLPKILGIAPNLIIMTFCFIFDLDYEHCLEKLTMKEFTDVIIEYWKMNDLTDFFRVVRGPTKGMLARIIHKD